MAHTTTRAQNSCGHGAFSSSYELNWIVGNAVHSIILAPYVSVIVPCNEL